ncbi:DUF3039 domain-containing protein [Kocuria rhizophila]|uniref:DUF3039 domain-containing protein n=1 Tax=Kocuria rhizophila TaxID=72000 RepID=UPI0011A619C9|nr:DUF3039 domain-containing protein [Kocuria rhizophila]
MSATAPLSHDGITITDEDLLAFFSDKKPPIVHRVNGETFNAAVRTGTPYTALCGRTWVPKRFGTPRGEALRRGRIPCDACEVIYNRLMSE